MYQAKNLLVYLNMELTSDIVQTVLANGERLIKILPYLQKL